MDQLLAERDWHKASRHMGNEAANHLAAFNFSEKVSVSDALCRKWRKAEQNRRKALAAGLIGSFVCYKKSCKTADKVPLFKSLERKFCSVMASTPIIQEPLERGWIKSCLKGILAYPERSEHCFVTRCLPWREYAGAWHFGAQDVTRIFADTTKYDTPEKCSNLQGEEVNELAYAMRNAPLLSGKHVPSEIRKSRFWAGSYLILLDILLRKQRIQKQAKRSEKLCLQMMSIEVFFPSMTKILNIAKVGSAIEGVSSRMGRTRLERQNHAINRSMGPGTLASSLDIKA